MAFPGDLTVRATSSTGADLSRRRFLQVAAGGIVTLSLAAACAPGNSSGAATQPTPAASGASGTSSAVYPSFIPQANGPKPDYPADSPQYDAGFEKYPANPVKALPADPPGAGGQVRIMSIALTPPPSPLEQNAAWQAVNKALNADVRFDIVSQADYQVKLGTMMAGNDVSDLFYLYARPGSPSTLAAAAGLPQFLQSQAADLTPYLGGDAAKDYPNLAAIPTQTWKNAGSAYQGKLYLIPIHRYLAGQMFIKNVPAWDAELGKDYVPKNADDFKRCLQALTKPQQGFYGIVAAQDSAMHVGIASAMFGAPNGWRLQSDGKLVKDVETPEYKDAVAYLRDLYAAGVFHPDSATMASNTIARTNFLAGKFAIHREPINGFQDAWRQSLQAAQPFEMRPLPLFPARDGGKPQHFVTGGHLWATGMKKGSPDRIKELLRIMNWLAAPFGSEEDRLLTFGLPNSDYTLDANGNPTVTQQGTREATYSLWKYTVQHPFVFFASDLPGFAKLMVDTEHVLMPAAVSDPTFGQVSTTNFSKGFTLAQGLTDGMTDIIVGRRPMSDFDQIVKDWQSNGGEQVRKEYQESIAVSG
jgi:putative aldouronate transport system substrate-binding protein